MLFAAGPWPEWAYKLTLEQAAEHIRRAAFLGRTTGQRRSDLVKLGRKHRDRDGPYSRCENFEIRTTSCR